MKLKLDDKGFAVLLDGKPVYVQDDGKETAYDVADLVHKVNARAAQSQRVEDENKELKAKLLTFDGIEDPKAAIKALGVVKNLNGKDVVDATEVERRIAEAGKVYEGRISEMSTANEALEGQLFETLVGGAFASSQFVKDKMILPADFVQARFGSNFGVEKGKVYAVDASGNKILSKNNPGELASVDEALEYLVLAHPQKDILLKGTGASGGGSHGGGGFNGAGGKRTITRSQFDLLGVVEKATAAKEATIVD
jgi:hypothetical protein